ncbi:MAG: PAS domain-containing sensor histidine kinase [Pseudomonadota bacterium]
MSSDTKQSGKLIYQTLFEQGPIATLLVNQSGKIDLANHHAASLFGYSNRELTGVDLSLLLPSQNQTVLRDLIDRPSGALPNCTIETDGTALQPSLFEQGLAKAYFGRHKSGAMIPVEIGLHPVQVGTKTYIISSIVDLTGRQEIGKHAQERSDEISEFSYRTSHDLKSPLSTVGGLIDFVIEDIEQGNLTDAAEGAHKIKRITERLNHLVEDILKLTKADHINEAQAIFDFDAYLAAAIEKHEQLRTEYGVELRGNFMHRKPLMTQTTRLSQVLDNLVSNAIKYSDQSKQDRFVSVRTFTDASTFYIQVEDNGIGIPKQQHAEVFSMFKRFHTDALAVEGSGLGLYMIKKHVTKIDAQISFESTAEGTTFYLELPLAAVQAPAECAA